MTPPRPALVDAFWKLVYPLRQPRPCDICHYEPALFLWPQGAPPYGYLCRACSLKRLPVLARRQRDSYIGNRDCQLCGKLYNRRAIVMSPGNSGAGNSSSVNGPYFHKACLKSVLEYEGLEVLVAIG